MPSPRSPTHDGDPDGGALEAIRLHARAGRARSLDRAGRGVRLSRAERGGQDDDDPSAARASIARAPGAPSSSASTHGATRSPRIAASRTSPGEPFLWPSLTGAETLEFLAQLRGGTDAAYRDVLIERFQFDTRKKVRALSKGNRQKVQLVAAFSTRADLLILDEPTSGLDPLMEIAFRETVHEAKERGQTIFLSSHILSEVEALCDRVGILRDGRMVDQGTLSELRHLAAQTVEVTFAGPAPTLPPLTGVHVAAGRRERAALRGDRQHRPADRRARAVPGAGADEPRAVARGDLHPPLRHDAGRWARRSALARRALRRRAHAHDLVRAALRRRGRRAGRRLPHDLPDACRPRRVRAHVRRQQRGAALLRRARTTC